MKLMDFLRGNTKQVICLSLVILIFGIYWQVAGHDFIMLDDNVFITENPTIKRGLTAEGISCAFTSCSLTEGIYTWHPLLWLSFMLDYRLYELKPAGYHIHNVIIHILNTILLFLILNRMTHSVWRSALVAVLFALHPLRVESVAWATERKDMLSTLFGLLAIGGYLFYVQHSSIGRYLAVTILFILSLMAKPMYVTLPFVLLLLDFWPLGRFGREISAKEEPKSSSPGYPAKQDLNRKRKAKKEVRTVTKKIPAVAEVRNPRPVALILEKIPLLALSILFSVINMYVQQKTGGINTSLSFFLRLQNAAVSYVIYIFKIFWPQNLAVFYPYPETMPLWQPLAAALLLIGITVAAFLYIRRFPWFFVGWSLYLGTLVPVSGIVQAGMQPMADRYTYFPHVGLFVVIVWGGATLAQTFHIRKTWLAGAAGIALSLLAVTTWIQITYWKDSATLFEHTLRVTSENAFVHRILADVLKKKGKTEEAIRHYRESLRIAPRDSETWNNLGVTIRRQGKDQEALSCFMEAVRLNPENYKAQNNVGSILASRGKIDEAIAYFQKAVRIEPGYAEPYIGWADALVSLGRVNDAMPLYEKALAINPRAADVLYNMGTIVAAQGRIDDALIYFQKAVAAKPDYAKAHNNLGNVMLMKGRWDEAILHFQTAIQIEPGYEMAKANLKQALLIEKQQQGKAGRR